MKSFSYTPDARFIEEFLLHTSDHGWSGGSLTFLMIVLLRSFSYTPQAMFIRSFSYTPEAGFSEEFLLHSSVYVW